MWVMKTVGKANILAVCVFIVGTLHVMHSAPPGFSLWGSTAAFLRAQCHDGFWQLAGRSLPALTELTVCVALRRQISSPRWTAFVYKHRGSTRPELGLSGCGGRLRIGLLGTEWEVPVDLPVSRWHAVCLTWSSARARLRLSVNGSLVFSTAFNSSGAGLAPAGSLTLGASHGYADGGIAMETGSDFLGEISLFRVWRRELSAAGCADGDVVGWDARVWDDGGCPAVPDSSLPCAWSAYVVQMSVGFAREDGRGVDGGFALAMTCHWLNNTLPRNISVQTVSVSFASQLQCYDSGVQVQDIKVENNSSTENCFDCLVYISVSPSADVRGVQDDVSGLLTPPYAHRRLVLTANPRSLQVVPINDVYDETEQASRGSAVGSACWAPPSENFYRVYLNVTIVGTPQNPEECIQIWIRTALRGEGMHVLHFAMLNKTHRLPISNKNTAGPLEMPFNESSYDCSFHVQAMTSLSVSETEILILDRLTENYTSGGLTLHTQRTAMHVSHIEPGFCPKQTQQTRQGLYLWPETWVQGVASLPCEGDPVVRASRSCLLAADADRAEWDPPVLDPCPLVINSVTDLDEVIVTPDNSADVVDMITDLIGNGAQLSLSELDVVLKKLAEVVEVSLVSTALGTSILKVIAELLQSQNDLRHDTNNILTIADSVGHRMNFPGESFNMTAPFLALSLINLDSAHLHGLSFGVSSFTYDDHPQVFINKIPSDPVAFVYLPPAMKDHFPLNNQTKHRVQFQFCGTSDLFQDLEGTILGTYVVSASVTNVSIKNLRQPITVTLRHSQPITAEDKVQCVYWDFQKNGGRGGWESQGCRWNASTANHTSCLCDHLTHFAVLLDHSKRHVQQQDEHILTLITYLGCGISSICLGISVLTYLAFENLRKDYPSKILINLSLALLGLNLLFLLDSWLASLGPAFCILAAVALHYFLLASFTWMGLEALHMYLALVRVFNIYVQSYLLKLCLLGWGIPLVIVCLVLAVDLDAYGLGNGLPKPVGDSELFCWLRDGVTFYLSVVTYVLLVLLCNALAFAVVLKQVHSLRANGLPGGHSGPLQHLRSVAGLSSLLGLTWALAFFTWGPVQVPLLYIFSILNTLQGFFIFLFHCVMKENVRKQWRAHLCAACWPPTDSADQSPSATPARRTQQKQEFHTSSIGSSCSLDQERAPSLEEHPGAQQNC